MITINHACLPTEKMVLGTQFHCVTAEFRGGVESSSSHKASHTSTTNFNSIIFFLILIGDVNTYTRTNAKSNYF